MRLKSDPRTVKQQVLSGLKKGAILVVAGGVVLAALSFASRPKIAAYLWHLVHGESVDVGQYRIPAPKHWLVRRINDTQIVLINLDTGDGIFVRHAPEGVTLAAWSQLITRFETKNPKAISQREFHFGGEHFICFEENFDTKLDHRYPIDCRSEGGLAVNFMPSTSVGKQHDAMFYALLQSIRKL